MAEKPQKQNFLILAKYSSNTRAFCGHEYEYGYWKSDGRGHEYEYGYWVTGMSMSMGIRDPTVTSTSMSTVSKYSSNTQSNTRVFGYSWEALLIK